MVVTCDPDSRKGSNMAKPNYPFEKRQREQQKKQKKAEKAQRKAQPAPAAPEADTPVPKPPPAE